MKISLSFFVLIFQYEIKCKSKNYQLSRTFLRNKLLNMNRDEHVKLHEYVSSRNRFLILILGVGQILWKMFLKIQCAL